MTIIETLRKHEDVFLHFEVKRLVKSSGYIPFFELREGATDYWWDVRHDIISFEECLRKDYELNGLGNEA